MFQNYIKIAYRNLVKQKGYSFINIVGLALGLSCTMILLLFIKSELSYDKFHENADNITRFTMTANIAGRLMEGSSSPLPLVNVLKSEYSDIIAATRLNQNREESVFYNNQNLLLSNWFFADDDIFKVFSFTKLQGELQLLKPNEMVISESSAKTYFKDQNPIGQIFNMDNESRTSLVIVGVYKDFPKESHIKPKFIASYKSYWRISQESVWLGFNTKTYALLKDGVTSQDFEKNMPIIIEKYMGKQLKQYGATIAMYTQALTDIYLHSEAYSNEFEQQGSMTNIYIMSIVALFLILIASINFMNLSTARSSKRAKEVGMRKVLGAQKNSLIYQFLGESLFLALISLVLAFSLIELFLPVFNSLANRTIEFNYLLQFDMVLSFIALTVLIGLLSGLYPAFYLSSFSPITVLKGTIQRTGSATYIRKGLVILQFTISITLIICTIIIINQLDFMQSKKLGFDKNQVIAVELPSNEANEKFDALKNKLLINPLIKHVSAGQNFPGDGNNNNSVYKAKESPDSESRLMDHTSVHNDYFKTLGIELKEGRFFSDKFSTDLNEAMIINQAAVEALGFTESPIGKKVTQVGRGEVYTVVGVVKNFHNRSLREKIQPYIFKRNNYPSTLLVRVGTSNVKESVSFIESEFLKMNPTANFDFEFLDQKFSRFYTQEKNTASIINVFTSLAIFIACLGLFGLASFMADQKLKEIGIRKVLGASIFNIFSIFAKEFGKLVIISITIASPLAYVFMSKWLQNFAYQLEISVSPFIIAGLSGIIITMITISYQAFKAATQNPILALNYE